MRKESYNLRNTKGITLIALIITIVVLVIMAGVTVTTIVNNGDTVEKAKTASDDTQRSNVQEALQMRLIELKSKVLQEAKDTKVDDLKEIDGEECSPYGMIEVEKDEEGNVLKETSGENDKEDVATVNYGGYIFKVNDALKIVQVIDGDGTIKYVENPDNPSDPGIIDNSKKINTTEALANIKNDLSGEYKLTNNMDLTGKTWKPLGTEEKPFTGKFDGQGATITGLTISSTEDNQGFFGVIGEGAEIKNLLIEGANVSGKDNVGILAGKAQNGAIIEKVYTSGKAQGTNNVGGIIGTLENSASKISNSYSSATATGTDTVGGLVGKVDAAEVNTTYAIGKVTGTSNVGGLTGTTVNGATTINSYWTRAGSGVRTSASGEVKKILELVNQGTYNSATWNFTEVWDIEEGDTTAYLRNMGKIPGAVYIDKELYAEKEKGDGTELSPYIITNRQQLEAVADNLSAHYELGKNIDLSDSAWTPLGKSNANFTGSLDGAGYKITGLNINSTSNYQGLFAYVGNGAVIKNLEIEGATVKGAGYTGILAGNVNNAKEISNVIIDGGTVTGSSENVGGMIGYYKCSTSTYTLENLRATGITVTSSTSYVGGLIGKVYDSYNTLNKTYTTGTVKGSYNVGGLIGYAVGYSSSNKFKITNAYSTADVTATATSTNLYSGGLIGYVQDVNITNTYAIGKVTGSTYAKGLVGNASSSTATNSYWTRETSKVQTSALGEVKLLSELARKNGYNEATWDFTNVWEITEGSTVAYLRNMETPHEVYVQAGTNYVTYESGTGTETDPYIIKTAEQLQDMKNKGEGHYKLGANISLSGRTWTTIGTSSAPFTGSLDGAGYKITGLNINSTSNYQGLFAYVGNGAVIKNLEIEGATVKGAGYTGILAGNVNNAKEISNVIIDGGTVTGSSENVGGMIGYYKCSTSTYTLENLRATGITVTSSTSYVGGLIGKVYDSYNTLNKTYTTGTVKGSYNVGGLIGYAVGYSSSNKFKITNAYSTADVTATATSTNLYSGGLIGYVQDVNITNTYAIGKVTGSTYAKGLVGNASSSTATNSYYDKETTERTTSALGTGKTTEEMQTPSTYENWDTSIWNIVQGAYPSFK